MIKTEFSVTLKSNDWFQCGEDVLLTVSVVWVCDPSTVNTAKGSGDLNISLLYNPSAARTLTVIFERGAGMVRCRYCGCVKCVWFQKCLCRTSGMDPVEMTNALVGSE